MFRRIYLVAMTAVALALPSCGTKERPEYIGEFAGDGAIAFLDQIDDELFYLNLQLEARVYGINAVYGDGTLSGSLDDFGQLPFSISPQAGGGELVLTVGGRTYRLRRRGDGSAADSTAGSTTGSEPPDSGTAPPATSASDDRDPRLVGSYSRQEMISTPEGGITTQMFLEIRADGTFSELLGDTVAGGAYLSGQVGDGTGAETAEWTTSGGVLLVRPVGGAQWVPLARYVLEPGVLMLVYDDGSRHLWYRG